MTEVDLCRVATEHLEERGWQVWPEVQLRTGEPRADLLAKKGKQIWAIEAKMRPTMGLNRQLLYWAEYMPLTSALFPSGVYLKLRNRSLIEEAFSAWGVGILGVERDRLFEFREPYRFQGRPNRTILDLLRAQRKIGIAGDIGEYHSPRLRTFALVKSAVADRPGGITPKELIKSIAHHYVNDGTARVQISKAIKRGDIAGVRRVRRFGQVYYVSDEWNE